MRTPLRATVRALPAALAPTGTAVGAALVLVLSGCSGDTSSPTGTATSPTAPVLRPGSPGEPNTSLSGSAALPTEAAAPREADVRFMQDMVVHHAQAIVMVGLVQDRLVDTQVKALAARIADEQRPEIGAMAKWLKDHDQDVPPQAKDPQYAAGADHAHVGMPGMATQAQLAELAKASGIQADRMWLRLMTAHHEGALAMVAQQHRDGTDDVVTQLGDEIHVTQSVQIGAMREMLDRLG